MPQYKPSFLRATLLEQAEIFWQRDTGIQRSLLPGVLAAARSPHAVIISGLRRVGKSTLLAQAAHRMGQDAFYYLNFEDERLSGLQVENINRLYQTLVELFGERKTFIIDEIQNLDRWELFVRRFMDNGFKFYLSGSNASLLSQELGTRLTGRYLPVELFPFSLEEYLNFRKIDIPDLKQLKTVDRAKIHNLLWDYLQQGGLPEPLKYPELPLHRLLYDDILYRDIAARHNIAEVRALKDLAFYLVSNPACLNSYSKLKQLLQLGSVNTVKSYLDYMENAWLLFSIHAQAYSVKRQQLSPKKVYFIDTGLVKSVGFSFSANRGRLLENCVFLALRRQFREIHYFMTASGHEIDFYIPAKQKLIQVAQNIEASGAFERETSGLFDAMEELGLDNGVLLVEESGQTEVHMNHKTIHVRSLFPWLLQPEVN